MNERISLPRKDSSRLSRRSFFNAAGAASSGLVAASVLPRTAYADDDESRGVTLPRLCELPNPIPHTTVTPFGTTIHFFFPGPVEGTPFPTDSTGSHVPGGRDPSVIFDFSGFIGQADLSLTGTGTDLNTGARAPYNFNTDMRFMKGTFVGTDGKSRKGAFAFI